MGDEQTRLDPAANRLRGDAQRARDLLHREELRALQVVRLMHGMAGFLAVLMPAVASRFVGGLVRIHALHVFAARRFFGIDEKI
ncbi:hypothetical protein [Polyangium spumosum]|uniref:hypothetical protein n=1 Tax=Polyangium spumosum TaxID=889282 RepID=UPI001F0DCFEF|nr:hypothetical protein [Polyangium spumosum]